MQIDSSLLSSLMWWNSSQELEENSTASGQSSSQPWWTETSSGSTADFVSLSPEFSVLQERFQLLSQNIQTRLQLGEINEKAQEKADSLGADLLQAFEENGIDLGEDGVNLTMDADGLVRVFGDHENKEAIEKFFRDNADWSERYADFHLYTEISHKLDQFLNPQTSTSSNPYVQNKKTEGAENIVLSLGSPDGIEVSFL